MRDSLRGQHPTDWDIATNAAPEEIQKLFPDNFYDNVFGTVTVKTRSDDPVVWTVQITPFRTEGAYTDNRHPDHITFASTIEEDLSRRDFTINAIAVALDGSMVDPYGGRADLEAGILPAVGDAHERFGEDALRLMRAVRFATTLDFAIENDTLKALVEYAPSIAGISVERVRDEFTKIMMSANPRIGITILVDTGLADIVLP